MEAVSNQKIGVNSGLRAVGRNNAASRNFNLIQNAVNIELNELLGQAEKIAADIEDIKRRTIGISAIARTVSGRKPAAQSQSLASLISDVRQETAAFLQKLISFEQSLNSRFESIQGQDSDVDYQIEVFISETRDTIKRMRSMLGPLDSVVGAALKAASVLETPMKLVKAAKNIQSTVKKVEFAASLLGNPVFWIVVAIILLLVLFLIIYAKLNDTTGGVVKVLCTRLEDCVKLMVQKGGNAVQNAN